MKKTLAVLAVLVALPLAAVAQEPAVQKPVAKTAAVTIKAIDATVPSVTVLTEDGHTASFKVDDKKNLLGLKAGDKVEITYTQAFAVSVK